MALAENIIAHPKSSKKTVPANVVTITPEMAEELLGKNVRNRRISRPLVDAYARDMTAGNWRFTGEAIKLSSDGKLLDGQHRLQACVIAKEPFTTLIVYGIEDEAQDVLDTGRARTVGDALALKGFSHSARTAAACRFMWNIKHGYGKNKISHSEMLSIFERHPGLNESAHAVVGAYGMSQALLAAIHYIGTHLLDKEPFASEFVTIFVTGNSYDGCAAHAWRERLMRMKAAHTPITHTAMFYGSLHSWNLFSAGTVTKQLRIPDSTKIKGLDVDLI